MRVRRQPPWMETTGKRGDGGGRALMRHYAHAVILCLLCPCLSLLLWSCSSSNRMDGYVYFRLNANPTTLDPALITDVPSSTVAAKLFNGLVVLQENLEVAPDIADRWEV